MISYYKLTGHEEGMVVELVTYLINQESENWVRELFHHCLKVGEIWGAFIGKGEKLVGVGFSFPSFNEPIYISASPISVFVCPVKEELEIRAWFEENLA